MRFIINLALAAMLAACGGKPVKLEFGDKADPSRITAVSGLKSHDAANVLTHKDYVEGKVKQPQKALVSFKAHPGQQITINAAEFTVWQPSRGDDQIEQAEQAEGELMQSARAGREFVGGTIKDATPALLGAAALEASKNSNKQATRRAEIQADTERARDASHAAQTGELIEALREKPQFFVLPAGAAPAPTPSE